MAVTANGTYGGGTFAGVVLEVQGAYITQSIEADDPGPRLVYQVKVTLPDGTVQMGTGWDNIKTKADISAGHGTPLEQAEADMKARLAAAGWTNVTDV